MNKILTSSILQPLPGRKAGHMLLVTLAAITVLGSIGGIALQRTLEASRIGARANNLAVQSRAADGILEYAFGVWKQAIVHKDLPLVKGAGSDNAALTPPVPSLPGVTYPVPLKIEPVNGFGAPTSSPVPASVYLDDYPGWKGNSYGYMASVTVQATGGPKGVQPIPTGAKRFFQYISVPLFQSMYFFETDLEIYRPAQMIIAGLVHSNSRLLLSGSADQSGVELEFNGFVSYAGGSATVPGYTTNEPPLGGPAWAGFTDSTAPSKMEAPKFSSGGAAEQIHQVARAEPYGKSPAAVLDAADANPNNDSFHELIEPPVAGQTDPPEISRRRLYNKAGIVITVNGTSTSSISVAAQNGTTLSATQITNIKSAYIGKTTMYDQREGKNVDVATFNMSTLATALNSAPGFNGVLYMQDVTPVSLADPEPKTVRVKNGGVLPTSGLTLATQNPLYIQGDYNTGTTTNPTSVPANSTGNPNNTSSPTVSGYVRKPSAVMADAVMLLSNAWSDSNASLALSNRRASNTTYNTAILAGFIPSGYDPDGTGPLVAYGYSGGANNFPRFLEDWSSRSCTYFGSMVSLYESKVFVGKWDTGVIYKPANRRWNFDTTFIGTPPPGTLDAVVIQRGGWTKY